MYRVDAPIGGVHQSGNLMVEEIPQYSISFYVTVQSPLQ